MAYQYLPTGTKAIFQGKPIIVLGHYVNEDGVVYLARNYMADGVFGRVVAAYVRAWTSDLAFRLRAKEARFLRLPEGGRFPKYSLTNIIGKPSFWISRWANHAPSHYFEVVSK